MWYLFGMISECENMKNIGKRVDYVNEFSLKKIGTKRVDYVNESLMDLIIG